MRVLVLHCLLRNDSIRCGEPESSLNGNLLTEGRCILVYSLWPEARRCVVLFLYINMYKGLSIFFFVGVECVSLPFRFLYIGSVCCVSVAGVPGAQDRDI